MMEKFSPATEDALRRHMETPDVDDYSDTERRKCDCVRVLPLWEDHEGDLCVQCFDRGNWGRFGGKPWAEFTGWQQQEYPYAPFPLFNIHGNHKLKGSTVTEETLRKSNIEVPRYPTFAEWRRRK